MGFLDRFKPKALSIGKQKKPKHVVAKSEKAKAEEEKRKRFAAVPAAGKPVSKIDADRKQPQVPADTRKKSQRKPKDDTGDAYRILLRSIVSEKATALSGQNQYVFVVADGANKISIKRAVESLYGVRPQKVNIMNVSGKHLRYGRTEGRTKNWRKAVVTLYPGQKLDVS